MKMSSDALCCDDCFHLIAKRNSTAASLWLDLCQLEKTYNIFGLRMDDFPNLRLLETMGLLVSTDTDELIIIKVNGKKIDEDGPYYCGDLCEQSKDL